MGGRGQSGKPKAPPVPTDRLLRSDQSSDQAIANSAVSDLDNLLDVLNSSLTSIEEDSKDLIEYRESTHFRAPSVEGAVGYHLPDSKIEPMSSNDQDLHYYEDEDDDEDEGGFTQVQLEALETGTVGKLSAFDKQPHLYAAALKAKSAAPFTAAPAVTRTQGLSFRNLSDQNMASANLGKLSALDGADIGPGSSSLDSSSKHVHSHKVRKDMAYAENHGVVQEELKRFGNLLVVQYGLASNKYNQVVEATGKHLSEADLQLLLVRVEQVIDRLNIYTNQLAEMSTKWEGGKSLEHHFLTLDEFLDAFNTLKVGIAAELEDKGQGAQQKPAPAQADFHKLLKVARAKPVDLPTYDGKSKASYKGFKESFKYIIERTNVPPELWGGTIGKLFNGGCTRLHRG